MILFILFGFSLLFVFMAAWFIRVFMKLGIKRFVSNESMKNKVIIVTGANSGIGYHAALDLARRGGRVILACRNENRGITARDNIIAETGNNNVVYKHLNLSALKSVRDFAEDIRLSEGRVDVLVNNAGVSALNDRLTEDNIVEEMQINYFAPFLLTLLLLPLLKKCQGRIVNVSSLCHYRGEINFEKINKVSAYDAVLTYANSKLCNIIFTKELARKLSDTKVTVNALHPGVIHTNIVDKDAPILRRFLFKIWCWFCCRTAEEGAQTIIYLSVADEVCKVSGKYFIDCKPAFVLWKANNEELAHKLWDYSKKLVNYSETK